MLTVKLEGLLEINEVIHAINLARTQVEAQFQECVKGWGKETYHSEVFKKQKEKLLDLQVLVQRKLQIEIEKSYN